MKLGFNLVLWTPYVTLKHEPILRKLKSVGYDGVEVPLLKGDPEHYKRLGELLDKVGLERTTSSVLRGVNPLSKDKESRAASLQYAKWIVDCSAALGSSTIAGPMHSERGVFTGQPATAAERQRAVGFHKRAGDYAAKKGIVFALEAVNRYEGYLFNTMQQLAEYLDEVDHPQIKGMYNTFHANIEEADVERAIKTIAPHLAHVHISESNRGTPGKGQVHWEKTYKAFKKVKYKGWMTIEAFARSNNELAGEVFVWRNLSTSPEETSKAGLLNMWEGTAHVRKSSSQSKQRKRSFFRPA